MQTIYLMQKRNSDLFNPGRLVLSQGISDSIGLDNDFAEFILTSCRRHINGDFGEISLKAAHQNHIGLQSGGRLFSAFRIDEIVIWILTEEDRSTTTILFPSEY